MSDDFRDARHTPVERLVERDKDVRAGEGRPLSRHARQYQRSLESYLQAGSPPRWMERVREIDLGIARERERLEREYRRLRERCGRDPGTFAQRWRTLAEGWRFDDGLKVLIEQHNEWYPIERRLPVNPRTGEYVLLAGRSYRRPGLDAGWVLSQFPAEPPSAADAA